MLALQDARFAAAMAISLLASAALPPLAAADSRSGDYIVLRAVGSVAALDDITSNSASPLQINNDSDLVTGPAVAIGYDWGKKGVPIRTELEYTMRFRFDFDTRINTAQRQGFENQLQSHSVMVNAYYDINVGWQRWTPYVGVGAGWTRNVSDVTQTNLATSVSVNRTDTVDNFSWSLMVGIEYDISDGWRLGLGYRYIDLGEVQQGPFPNGQAISADSYTSHDVIIGATYKF